MLISSCKPITLQDAENLFFPQKSVPFQRRIEILDDPLQCMLMTELIDWRPSLGDDFSGKCQDRKWRGKHHDGRCCPLVGDFSHRFSQPDLIVSFACSFPSISPPYAALTHVVTPAPWAKQDKRSSLLAPVVRHFLSRSRLSLFGGRRPRGLISIARKLLCIMVVITETCNLPRIFPHGLFWWTSFYNGPAGLWPLSLIKPFVFCTPTSISYCQPAMILCQHWYMAQKANHTLPDPSPAVPMELCIIALAKRNTRMRSWFSSKFLSVHARQSHHWSLLSLLHPTAQISAILLSALMIIIIHYDSWLSLPIAMPARDIFFLLSLCYVIEHCSNRL